jgi:hypothetical protein
MSDWEPRTSIEVLVTDHLKGGLSYTGLGGRHLFSANPYGFGMWRVSDGQADFRFSQNDLDQQEWIEEIV